MTVSVPFDVNVHVDADDIVRALGRDDVVLNFVCQLIAQTRSSDLREQLAERLGFFRDNEGRSDFNPKHWDDEDYLPQEGNT